MHILGALGTVDAADVVRGAGRHDADAVHLGPHGHKVPRLLTLCRGRPPLLLHESWFGIVCETYTHYMMQMQFILACIIIRSLASAPLCLPLLLHESRVSITCGSYAQQAGSRAWVGNGNATTECTHNSAIWYSQACKSRYLASLGVYSMRGGLCKAACLQTGAATELLTRSMAATENRASVKAA